MQGDRFRGYDVEIEILTIAGEAMSNWGSKNRK
jgi:hypothetical protein